MPYVFKVQKLLLMMFTVKYCFCLFMDEIYNSIISNYSKTNWDEVSDVISDNSLYPKFGKNTEQVRYIRGFVR